MTAIDTNILIAILVSSAEGHAEAMAGIENLDDTLAITHVNIGEVLRLLTHPKVFRKPMKVPDAVDLLNDLIEAYDIAVLSPSQSWWSDLKTLAQSEIPDLRGNHVFDAQIALCLKYNGVNRLWTKNSDFRKYPGLQVVHFVQPA